MDLFYRQAVTEDERVAPFLKMQEQGLLPSAMSCIEAPTLEQWVGITAKGVLLLCESGEGDLLGCGHFTHFRGQVWEFDFTAYREAFHIAPQMAQGGFRWAFEHLHASAIVGFCAEPNRQAWRLAQACGFQVIGTIPGLCWFARRKNHVGGVMVMATPQSVEDADMSFGGSSTPSIQETPKPQVTKPVTEAATAARDSQRERAARAAGLRASILTSPFDSQTATQKTLLGQ